MSNITFCTVCMNRLHHLKITLPQNLLDNKDSSNAKFLLLDYNSKDGLEDWIKSNLNREIADGRLVYYRTNAPQSFHRSHSRNLAFKLANDGLICNVDADNFTGKHFSEYLTKLYEKNKPCIMAVDRMNLKGVLRDVVGRICLSKQSFLNVNGFDESMQDYGFEDVDLVNRVNAIGCSVIYMKESKYLKAISHSNLERFAEENITKLLADVLIFPIEAQLTDVILLYNNNQFERGTLYDNIKFYFVKSTDEEVTKKQNYPRYLIQGNWQTGRWLHDHSGLVLNFDHSETWNLLAKDHRCYDVNGKSMLYYSILENGARMDQIKEFCSTMNNWKKMSDNELLKVSQINVEGFGKGIVYKNFEPVPFPVN